MVQKRLAELRSQRLEKVKRLKQLGINPYPHKFDKKQTCSQASESLGKKVKTAARIISLRGHGRILFADIADSTGKIQLWFQEENLGKEKFKLLKLFDIGDFIGVEGGVVKTKTGEITIDVADFIMLSKALRPLPAKWHGLKDVEERYRKRYLDLLIDPEVRKRFDARTKILTLVREFLNKDGYTEVETPVLQPLYGGTNAAPFETHLNALDIDMYLRIAPELYLKRLVVGGYEKVYEIAKNFRNEGMDLSHNPEFTMIEFYEAYADYQRMMDITEGMYKYIAKNLFGKEQITVGSKKISLSGNWPRVAMADIIRKKLDLTLGDMSDDALLAYAQKNKIELRGDESRGEVVFAIFEHLVTPKLIDPIWILDYPIEVSPLSKKHRKTDGLVERFEGYIGGKEICDGWSEIIDPIEQRDRFENEQKALKKGREEAHPVDEEFLEAMEYGMPVLGGIGIGIDRMVMFFTNTWSIKEVMLFPLLKPKNKKGGKSGQK